MSTDYIVVFVTAPSREVGQAIGAQLVKRKLAACANILPEVISIYRWEGEIQNDSEALLVIKTRRELLEQLIAAVEELHPYELPEVIGLPILAGSPRYLKWIGAETGA